MFELKVVAKKILGTCTANPPVVVGDNFTITNGDLRIPEGSAVCMWALQSLLPLLPAKERASADADKNDWMWRVHHAQCPDPDGRVVFGIERTELGAGDTASAATGANPARQSCPPQPGHVPEQRFIDLRVVVEEVRGKCTSGMAPGDTVILRGGKLQIPAGRHFCLYALAAALPLLPPKQRQLADGDWLREAAHVICPDPAGNVILRIEPLAEPPASTH